MLLLMTVAAAAVLGLVTAPRLNPTPSAPVTFSVYAPGIETFPSDQGRPRGGRRNLIDVDRCAAAAERDRIGRGAVAECGVRIAAQRETSGGTDADARGIAEGVGALRIRMVPLVIVTAPVMLLVPCKMSVPAAVARSSAKAAEPCMMFPVMVAVPVPVKLSFGVAVELVVKPAIVNGAALAMVKVVAVALVCAIAPTAKV